MSQLISRRTLLSLLPAASLLPRTLLAAPGKKSARIFIGTGTSKGTSKGIYSAEWDVATGAIGTPSLSATLESPTFLALDPKRKYLYALSEIDDGKVTAFRYDEGGTLTRINEVSAQGAGPAHVSVHPSGRCAFVANYGGGSITSFQIKNDGSLSEGVSHFKYLAGESHEKDATPDAKSHAHCVTPTPDGKWLLVNDLGLDRILVYHVDPSTAELTPNDPPFWQARAGSGPRHLALHPNGKWIYNVNELDSTVDLLAWDHDKGTLKAIDFLSTVPKDFPLHTAFAGEITITHDGRFVYVGNRRHESIAVLPVDPATGKLNIAQLAANGGKNTRHIALDPSNRWLVLSDMDTGGIVVLERDAQTGKLSDPVHTIALDNPECVVFA